MTEEKRLVKVAILLGITFTLIIGGMYAAFVSAQTGDTSNGLSHTLVVSGTGEVKIAPNEAQVMLGAVTKGSTAQEASSANSKIINQLIEKLHTIGINNDDIVTISYYVYPVYEYVLREVPPTAIGGIEKNQIISGYQAQHDLRVTVRNSNVTQLSGLVGQIIDIAVNAGANQLSGVQFTVSEETAQQLNKEAMQRAIQNAATKAEVMANALGVRVAGVQSVTESSQFITPIRFSSVTADPEKGTVIMPPSTVIATVATVQVTYIIQ
jgi:uncharacterized protein YggE